VIDLAVVGPDEIWIVDFKTDEVAGREAGARAKAYAPQLAVYALALERIFRRPVTQRWVHFFSAGQSLALH
jgi:ATP-dependent helicase/nuclease subunit A